jgi:hypothetical protein
LQWRMGTGLDHRLAQRDDDHVAGFDGARS